MRRAVGALIGGCAVALALAGCADQPSEAAPIAGSVVLGEGGRFPGQFGYPRAIDVLGEHLVVIDKLGRIQVLEPVRGDCVALWEMPKSELGKPCGVTVAPGPSGEPAIYIADTHYQRVMVYAAPDLSSNPPSNLSASPLEAAPPLLASFGSIGTGPGQFRYPTDIAVRVGSDGRPDRIFVSEYGGNDRVSIFDGSVFEAGGEAAFVASVGAWGRPDEEGVRFDRPQSIALVAGELVVCDSGNHRLGRFTHDGELLGWVEAGGSGTLSHPYGIAALGTSPSDRRVFVAEFGGGTLRLVDLQNDTTLAVFGEPGRGEGQLSTPWGVAILGDTVFALDSGNNRLLAFDPRGLGL